MKNERKTEAVFHVSCNAALQRDDRLLDLICWRTYCNWCKRKLFKLYRQSRTFTHSTFLVFSTKTGNSFNTNDDVFFPAFTEPLDVSNLTVFFILCSTYEYDWKFDKYHEAAVMAVTQNVCLSVCSPVCLLFRILDRYTIPWCRPFQLCFSSSSLPLSIWSDHRIMKGYPQKCSNSKNIQWHLMDISWRWWCDDYEQFSRKGWWGSVGTFGGVWMDRLYSWGDNFLAEDCVIRWFWTPTHLKTCRG